MASLSFEKLEVNELSQELCHMKINSCEAKPNFWASWYSKILCSTRCKML